MKTKAFISLVIICAVLASGALPALAQTTDDTAAQTEQITEPLYKPLIERYILDELKQLRHEQLTLKAEVTEKIATAKLEASDRAIRYTADTTNNIFYIITVTATILVLLGWKSLRDIRQNIESITEVKLAELTQKYEERLSELEEKIRVRSEQIIATQEDISNTNVIHSLWMRAGLEKSDQEKIKIYDHILQLKPGDIEALTYKADVLLDMGEKKWALSLADQAIERDREYALAYWQRACAKAELDLTDEAMEDLRTAINLSEHLKSEVAGEKYFKKLSTMPEFQELIQ